MPSLTPEPTFERTSGYTLLEMMFSMVLLTTLLGGIAAAFVTIQSSFDEEVSEAQLQFRSRSAMDRLSHVASRALTSDPTFALLPASNAPTARGLTFRNFLTVDAVGDPIYDDLLRVFLIGDSGGQTPASGVVVAHGPSLDAIGLACAGPDGLLGTADDDLAVEYAAGVPAVELLVPDWLAPQAGRMLEITEEAGANGRLLKITLRTNFLLPDGTFLRSTDLVLEERVALKW